MPILLFIYGTLHPDRAPRAIADVVRRLKPVGAGTIRGRMFDLGEYPGVVLDDSAGDAAFAAAPGTIPGEVFEVPDAETLVRLDAYEDYRPGDPGASLFLRVETTVAMSDGSERTCWVYIYNGGPQETRNMVAMHG